jgi:hypothetical protein
MRSAVNGAGVVVLSPKRKEVGMRWSACWMALLVLLTPMRPPAARLHNRLVRAAPGVDATVTAAPTAIVLWFSERPDVALSAIRLRPAQDTTREMPTGKVAPGPDSNAIAVALTGPLPGGSYLVAYRTAGDDGHVVRGQYRFTVRLP